MTREFFGSYEDGTFVLVTATTRPLAALDHLQYSYIYESGYPDYSTEFRFVEPKRPRRQRSITI